MGRGPKTIIPEENKVSAEFAYNLVNTFKEENELLRQQCQEKDREMARLKGLLEKHFYEGMFTDTKEDRADAFKKWERFAKLNNL